MTIEGSKLPENTDSPDLLPTAGNARVRAGIKALIRPHRSIAFGGFVLTFAASGLGLLIPPLLGHLVDIVAQSRPIEHINLPVLLIVLVAIAQATATTFGLVCVSEFGERSLASLRENFVHRAFNLPLNRLETAGSGDLTARVTNDVSTIAQAVRNALPALARSGLTIGLTLVGLIVLDWRFALTALIVVPVHTLTVRWYLRRAVPLYSRQRVAAGAQQQQLLETVGGASTVRTYRLGEQHLARVGRRSGHAVELMLRGVRLVTGFYNGLNAAEFIGLAAVLGTALVLVGNGAVTIGTATTAALYFHNLFNPINAALRLLDETQTARASLARLVGVADLPPRPELPPVSLVDFSIKVAGVEHAYRHGRPSLSGIDLEIQHGEHVALVGASGAGKTTLAKLIAGVHQPNAGTIKLGGVDLDDLDPLGTSEYVGLVSQEVHVFAGTLAEDLRLARPDASDADLELALETVSALEWVRLLPQGTDTVVGEGGHRLTVTQAQQLALARLVLADPPVAILDEATAEAGSAGARMLDIATSNVLEGRTALVVAHRLTQAANCDRIVVLDDGRVTETGTHRQLLEADGHYAYLWRAWSTTRTPG